MTLNNIFPSVAIVDYSLYYFILLSMLIVTGVWYLARWYKKHKKRTRNYYITLLEKSINEQAKYTAYKLTYYGKYVVRTSRQKEKLLQLLDILEPFKYQKKSPFLDAETRKQVVDFLDILRHKDV